MGVSPLPSNTVNDMFAILLGIESRKSLDYYSVRHASDRCPNLPILGPVTRSGVEFDRVRFGYTASAPVPHDVVDRTACSMCLPSSARPAPARRPWRSRTPASTDAGTVRGRARSTRRMSAAVDGVPGRTCSMGTLIDNIRLGRPKRRMMRSCARPSWWASAKSRNVRPTATNGEGGKLVRRRAPTRIHCARRATGSAEPDEATSALTETRLISTSAWRSCVPRRR